VPAGVHLDALELFELIFGEGALEGYCEGSDVLSSTQLVVPGLVGDGEAAQTNVASAQGEDERIEQRIGGSEQGEDVAFFDLNDAKSVTEEVGGSHLGS
jgi:hypothetical protein